MKEKSGTDYGFGHEIMASCLIQGCQEWGYNIQGPFIDPEEIVRFVKKTPTPIYVENGIAILQNYQKEFAGYFQKIGLDMCKLIEELKTITAS